MPADRSLSDVLSDAGRRGAEAAWKDVTPEQRSERTATARRAARIAAEAEVAMRQALAARLAALQTAILTLPKVERARQLRALADFAEADVELDERRRKRRGAKPLTDAKLAS